MKDACELEEIDVEWYCFGARREQGFRAVSGLFPRKKKSLRLAEFRVTT
jgi:hypothetical protein